MRDYRGATSKDIIVGNIIHIYGDDNSFHKKEIVEVHFPSDRFKAFTADDGCRYGLDACYIKTYDYGEDYQKGYDHYSKEPNMSRNQLKKHREGFRDGYDNAVIRDSTNQEKEAWEEISEDCPFRNHFYEDDIGSINDVSYEYNYCHARSNANNKNCSRDNCAIVYLIEKMKYL